MLVHFLDSNFFQSLVAITAVGLAWRSSKKQIQAARNQAETDARSARELAERNDTRQRWWEAVRWYHEQRSAIGEDAFLSGIESLSDSVQVKTEAQRRTLRAVTNAPKPKE